MFLLFMVSVRNYIQTLSPVVSLHETFIPKCNGENSHMIETR